MWSWCCCCWWWWWLVIDVVSATVVVVVVVTVVMVVLSGTVGIVVATRWPNLFWLCGGGRTEGRLLFLRRQLGEKSIHPQNLYLALWYIPVE